MNYDTLNHDNDIRDNNAPDLHNEIRHWTS